MSFAGSALILVTAALRTLTLDKLPKRTFLILWGVAALRLLIPFSIPSPYSVYSLAERETDVGIVELLTAPAEIPAYATFSHDPPPTAVVPVPNAPESHTTALPWHALWRSGALLCAAFFTIAYTKCRKDFQTSLPLQDSLVRDWLACHPLRRSVAIRQSSQIHAPLTYGIFSPVILLPQNVDWADEELAAYVLEHEYIHIQRFDALAKLALTAAVCLHWFNPLVWMMYVLANRDIELSCDEEVVRRFGVGKRSAYAMALVHMEETKSALWPLANGFSKNAVEERITAIMKFKKKSTLAILFAITLVCGATVGFATSAASDDPRDLLKSVDLGFSEEENHRLLALWIEDYENMTVADYQDRMWADRDNPEDIDLFDRFANSALDITAVDRRERDALAAYLEYFFHVYEPLTAERWRSRNFSGAEMADGLQVYSPTDEASPANCAEMEYNFTLLVLDENRLKVGEYEQAYHDVKENIAAILRGRTSEELRNATYMRQFLSRETETIAEQISTDRLRVQVTDFTFRPIEADDPDADLQEQYSSEDAEKWDALLSPYTEFGLTYQFDDPDHDGNGLKMFFNGREVCGIMDEMEQIWITEHTGNTLFGADAVELYAVYEDGRLSGLRPAAPEEQAEWNRLREENSAKSYSPFEQFSLAGEEQREFPNATAEDYAEFLTLMSDVRTGHLPDYASCPYSDYQDMPLSEFNMRLLDWGNEHPDAYDRISCDVIWDDYAVELTEDQKRFVSLSTRLSGVENAMYVRSSYTGRPEEDPDVSGSLPEFLKVESSITVAWCDLYYSFSYHIPDKSAITVRQRDASISGMMEAIQDFWYETSMEDLLRMTEEEVVLRMNAMAQENSGSLIAIRPLTTDDIYFEAADERPSLQ